MGTDHGKPELPTELTHLESLLLATSQSRFERVKQQLLARLQDEGLVEKPADSGPETAAATSSVPVCVVVPTTVSPVAACDRLAFLDTLTTCSGFAAITSVLYAQACEIGIQRIRVYLFDPRSKRLFGIDAAGHDAVVTTLLRFGELSKVQQFSALERSDSYWCLHHNRSVVVRVEPDAQLPVMGTERPDGLLEISVTEQCPPLAGQRSRVHVDVPFPQRQGKVSCDFVGEQLPPDIAQRIQVFREYVDLAAPYLIAAYYNEVELRLANARAMLEGADGSDEFGERCLRVFADVFDFDTAELYEAQCDSRGCTRLVLRNTTLAGISRRFETNVRVGDSHVLSNVAQQRQVWALTLADPSTWDGLEPGLTAADLRAQLQLDATDVTVCVLPLEDAQRTLCGVLVCRRQTLRPLIYDRVVLHRFVTEVAPQILSELNRRAPLYAVARFWEPTKEVSFLDYGALSELLGKISRTMCRVFEGRPANHLFLLNILVDAGSFSHFILGGRLPTTSRPNEKFELEGSLTRKVCEHGFVFLNDLDRAHEEGWLLRIAKSAVTAMGARVSYGQENVHKRVDFGALVVMSDKFDLEPREQACVLQHLADRIGENLARRNVHGFLLKGLEREAHSIEKKMQRCVEVLRKSEPDDGQAAEALEELERLVPVSRRAIHAAGDVISPQRAIPSVEACNVYDVVQEVSAVFRKSDFRNCIAKDLQVHASKSMLSTILLKLFLYLQRTTDTKTAEVNGFVRGAGDDAELVLTVDGIRQIPASHADIFQILQSEETGTEKSRLAGYKMATSLAQAHFSRSGRCGRVFFDEARDSGHATCQIVLPL